MKSRAEAVAELLNILDGEKRGNMRMLGHEPPPATSGFLPHHWGKVELRLFLDFLYDGPPQHWSEQLPPRPPET